MNQVSFYSLDKPGIKTYDVPENFNELDQFQLVEIMKILHSGLSPHEAQIRVLTILLRYDKRPALFKKHLAGISQGLQDLLLLTEFAFEPSNLTISPFPFIKINGLFKRPLILFGPVDKKILTYMDFLEWIKSETYYRQYLSNYKNEKKRLESLDQLVAVLYRPKGKNEKGDLREPYNDYSVEKRAKDIARVSPYIKYAIFYHFVAHREIWSKNFPHVYTKSDQAHDDNAKVVSGDIDLFKIMLKLAGSSKDMKALGKTEAAVVLLELNQKIEESKNNESQRRN